LLHYNNCITNNQLALRPNHSLKLTENTARFPPREQNFLGKWLRLPRV
jgi:hypothetical protein